MALPVSVPIGQSVIVIDAATTNTTQLVFTFQPRPGGGNFNAILQVTGTFTVATGELFFSLDGGTTWTSTHAAYDLAATKLFAFTDFIAGVLYRFTTAAFSGTSVTVTICRN